MTIAAGILCSDGMVLCADTEETISEDRKGNAAKIRTMQCHSWIDAESFGAPRHDWTVGIAGAGHSDWVMKFVQQFDVSVLQKLDKQADLRVFEKLLEEYNQGFFGKYIKGYAQNPAHRPQVQMLILVQFGKDQFLREIYRTNDNVLLDTEASASCVAVGKGAPAFQSLADRFLKPSYTKKEAAAISAYIMQKVKSEVPGCGGNSHILMIGSDGKEGKIPTSRIRELEFYHAGIEMNSDDLLAAELIKELP